MGRTALNVERAQLARASSNEARSKPEDSRRSWGDPEMDRLYHAELIGGEW